MCGIVSYIGNKDPIPILIKGLRRLEYRGYDSAGLALLDGKNLNSVKKLGKYLNYQMNYLFRQLKEIVELLILGGQHMVYPMI